MNECYRYKLATDELKMNGQIHEWLIEFMVLYNWMNEWMGALKSKKNEWVITDWMSDNWMDEKKTWMNDSSMDDWLLNEWMITDWVSDNWMDDRYWMNEW